MGSTRNIEHPECQTVDVPKNLKILSGKRRWDLLPWEIIGEVVQVFEHGAEKYGDHNWRNERKPIIYWSAALRHLIAWVGGEKKDPETGLSHISHAIAGLMILSALNKGEEN